MTTLDEICIRCGADKASVHTNGGHDYARHYDAAFSPMRSSPVKLLEIGVDQGASIRAWLEYFPHGKIFGVDNARCPLIGNSRYTFESGDQRRPEFWIEFTGKHGTAWDIIIDDGGHYADMVIVAFGCLWPCVKPGGLYCVEDLGTGYPGYVQGRVQCNEVYLKNCIPAGWPNHKDHLKNLVDDVNLGREIDSISFSKELAIIRKAK